MGVRGNGFRKELRGGKPRWIIDFRYLTKNGREVRFRRDASVQTATAARAEADRLRALAATTGAIRVVSEAPTFASFAAGDFEKVHMATRCRPATRERYLALFGQGMFDALGAKRLDMITPADIRRYT